MAPLNTTIGTAQVIASLPTSFTESVQDGTSAAEVWFAYTAQPGDTVIGFSGVAWYYVPGSDPPVVMGYAPRMVMYSLVGGVPTLSGYTPLAFPVTVGETYWLRVWNSLGGTTTDAELIFSGTNDPAGDPVIPDPDVEEPYSGTAVDVGTLPVDLSLDVGEGFVYPSTFWFKYTATAADTVCIGVWARFAEAAAYADCVWYAGEPGGHTPRFEWGDSPGNYLDQAFFLETTPGVTYYFRIYNAGDPTTEPLLVQMRANPQATIPVGSIVIPWDIEGTFVTTTPPAAAFDASTGEVLQMVPMPVCEFGDTVPLPSGMSLVNADKVSGDVALYDAALTPVLTIEGVGDDDTYPFIVSDGAHTFYVGPCNTASPWIYKTVSDAGVVGATTWSIAGGTGVELAMAPSRDGAILYHANVQPDGFCHIHQYDLVNEVELDDLVTLTSATVVVTDCLRVLADDTILAGLRYTTPNPDQYRVCRYDTDGTLLNTYTPDGVERVNRIGAALDDPDSFWVWTWYPDSTWQQTFTRYQTSDGTILDQFTVPIFDNYAGNANSGYWSEATEAEVFGAAKSCPMLVLREIIGGSSVSPSQSASASPSSSPSASTEEEVRLIRRLRQTPHLNDEQLGFFLHRIQLDLETGRGLTTGQGIDPQIMLQWSDDGGKTWSDEHWVSAGVQGAYRWRAIWRRMGRSRDRVWRVVMSDPVPWRLLDVYGQLEQGTT